MKNNNGLKQIENTDDIKLLLEELKPFNLNCEIVGSWIWVTGKNSYSARFILKSYSFKFSKNKKAWYFSGSLNNKKYKGFYKDLDEIKQRYKSLNLNEVLA